jgi:hypothetical protein
LNARRDGAATPTEVRPAANDRLPRMRAVDLMLTSTELARHMADLARLQAGQRLLEPSAGTGRLIDAAGMAAWGFVGELIAVEDNPSLAQALLFKYGHLKGVVKVHHGDFLACGPEFLNKFDRILMVPPRVDGAAHIMHAVKFLYRGGCLVGLVAEPPPSFAVFVESMSGTVSPLPSDSFREAMDGACIVVIEGK